ncbi:hypothetical protein Tco_0049693, partial [Tanacetum coccineum]
RIVFSNDEEGLKDPSKQGRKIIKIDQDPSISLVQDEGTSWIQEDTEIQEKIRDDTDVVLQEEELTEVVEDQGSGEKEVSTIGAEHSTVIPEVSTAAENLVYIKRSAEKKMDKGKGIMAKSEPEKKTKKQLEQERLGHEEVVRVVAKDDQAHVIDWSDPAVLRYHALQNRPYSVAEVRKNMCIYFKNQGGFKMRHFKRMSYKEIRPIFERLWDQNQSFVPIDSEDKEKGSKKKAGGSRKKTLAKKTFYKKRAGEKQSDQSAKRQKTEYEKEKEELKAYLDIVPGEEFAMDFESLATKCPTVDWKTHVLTENFMYYQIFRADGISKNYKIFSKMLDNFDR